MGFRPGAGRVRFHEQRHREAYRDSGDRRRGDPLHLFLQKLPHPVRIPFRAFDDQFVVDLEHQPCLRAFICQAVPHPHHGKLDDVGRRPLDRHVERDPFPEGAHVKVGALQLRQVPAPVPERPDTAGLLRGGDNVVHVLPHAAVAVEIGLHISLCPSEKAEMP